MVAYLVDPGSRDYYLASSADEIFVTPLSTLNVVGISARVNFLKDALSRFGIRTEVVAVSPYKSAGDNLSRSDFSEESREQTDRLLDRRFGALVGAISTGRGISSDEARRLIDGAPYTATAAEEKGLIDGVLYEDELSGRLGEGGGASGYRSGPGLVGPSACHTGRGRGGLWRSLGSRGRSCAGRAGSSRYRFR